MKIVAINASSRGDRGFTQEILNLVKEGAEESGASFETVILANHKINPCLGCEVCHTEKSYLKCVFHEKDDVQGIFQRMREADLLIYATPIYVFNMSGLMKTLFDRMNSTGDINTLQMSKQGLFFHHIDKDLSSKPFVLLTTCGNVEPETNQSVITYFKIYAKFMDAPMVGTLTRKSSFLLQRKTEQELPIKKAVYQAFRNAGRELVQNGAISKKVQKQAMQNVIPLPKPITFLMKIRPLRTTLLAEGLKRNAHRFK